MSEIQNLLKKISQNPELINKIKNSKKFEEIHEIFKKVDPTITQEDVENEMKKSSQISNEKLEMVAGGKMDFSKFKASTVAALVFMGGISTIAEPGVSACEPGTLKATNISQSTDVIKDQEGLNAARRVLNKIKNLLREDTSATKNKHKSVDDVSLTIYYMGPNGSTRDPWDVNKLINDSHICKTGKTVVSGSDLKEHIDLLDQVNDSTLVPAAQKSYLNARIHYTFESKKDGKVFDVTTGENDSMFVNGIQIKENDVFYNLIIPFLPERDAKELKNYVVKPRILVPEPSASRIATNVIRGVDIKKDQQELSAALGSLNKIKKLLREKFDDVSLTIYHIGCGVATRAPLNVSDLIRSSECKVVVSGNELKQHIDLLDQINVDTLIPVEQKSHIDARIYYIFESKKDGALFDVVMWGENNSMFINGIEVKGNDAFYNLIIPFLPEPEAKELSNCVSVAKT